MHGILGTYLKSDGHACWIPGGKIQQPALAELLIGDLAIDDNFDPHPDMSQNGSWECMINNAVALAAVKRHVYVPYSTWPISLRFWSARHIPAGTWDPSGFLSMLEVSPAVSYTHLTLPTKRIV